MADRWFLGLPYGENLTNFQRMSPVTHVGNAKTPTLILQGEADPTDSLGQSMQFYRGLQAYQVKSELVIYPREGHVFNEQVHLVDMYNRILGWIDTYVPEKN